MVIAAQVLLDRGMSWFYALRSSLLELENYLNRLRDRGEVGFATVYLACVIEEVDVMQLEEFCFRCSPVGVLVCLRIFA